MAALARNGAAELLQIGARFTPPACCTIYRTVRAEACGNIELTFYDLLDQLHTGHDAPGVEEALESEHWTHAAFYPPVILFDNIAQVGI